MKSNFTSQTKLTNLISPTYLHIAEQRGNAKGSALAGMHILFRNESFHFDGRPDTLLSGEATRKTTQVVHVICILFLL